MPEETNPNAQDAAGNEPVETVEPQDVSALPKWAQDVIAATRKENAERRVAAKTADAQRQAAEAARLADEQKWQELARLRETELTGLKPKAERVEAIETWLQSSVEKRIEALPQPYRGLVPQYEDPLKTLQWLDANAGILGKPQPPNTDAGNRGDGQSVTPPNAKQMAAADLAKQYGFNVTADAVALRQKQIEQQRQRKPQGDS